MLELIELKNTLFNFFMPRRGPPPALTPPPLPPQLPPRGDGGGHGGPMGNSKGGRPQTNYLLRNSKLEKCYTELK
jgi:hypothetical protein